MKEHVPYRRMAVVGWRNVFTDGTLTASSETSSGPMENAVDGLTFDWWEFDGSSSGDWLAVALGLEVECDYLAIAAHTLGSVGCSIEVQGSADGSIWSTVGGPFVPATDNPYLWRFDAASFPFWRVLIKGESARLGVVQLGEGLLLPEGIFVGHKPAALNRKVSVLPARSESGQFLGRSVLRYGAQGQIVQDRVAQTWVREQWDPFVRFAETRPFFFSWRYDDFPLEVIYGWTPEGSGSEVAQGANGYMKVSLEMEGIVGVQAEPQYLLINEDGSMLMTNEGDDGAPLLISET